MKDIHKGIILLILALLASISSLYVEDRHWEMPFITFELQSHKDVSDLQAQLLAGLDPTENAEPTAAGRPVTVPLEQCLKGRITRDAGSDLYHDASYVAVKDESNTYIELPSKRVLMLKGAFETQSASIIETIPGDVERRLSNASNASNCSKIDLYLSRIKS